MLSLALLYDTDAIIASKIKCVPASTNMTNLNARKCCLCSVADYWDDQKLSHNQLLSGTSKQVPSIDFYSQSALEMLPLSPLSPLVALADGINWLITLAPNRRLTLGGSADLQGTLQYLPTLTHATEQTIS